MNGSVAALPMYAVPRPALALFWEAVRRHLVADGIADAPVALAEPEDLRTHWLDPNLLLSQTCGYPLVTSLAGRVRYVATPCYDAPGCQGPCYSSVVLVRAADPSETLGDLRGRTVAFNDPQSQSGMNGLRALVAPLAKHGRFFGASLETGAHRLSIAALLDGRADVVAIDAVTWALATDASPNLASSLRVLCRTAEVPALPFVTALSSSDATVAALRSALQAACRDPDLAPVGRAMRLRDVVVLEPSCYDAISRLEQESRRLGYPALR